MRALFVACLVAVFASTGCRVTVHDNPPPRRHVVVEEVHYHDDHCGHCWDGNAWISIGVHHHYRGCGHYWYGGRWCVYEERPRQTVIVEERPRQTVIVEERPTTVIVEERHVCHAGCSHYYDGRVWVTVGGGHRHGPGCGHVFLNNRWTVQVRVR